MNARTSIYGVIIVFFLCSNATYAQEKKQTYIIITKKSLVEQDPKPSQSTFTTIEKNFEYREGQYRWLEKNKFSVADYGWDDDEINLNLDAALYRRGAAHTTLVAGITVAVLGVAGNALAYMGYALNEDPDKQKPRFIVFPFIASAGFFVWSGALSKKAHRKLGKAKHLRKSYSPPY